MNQNSPQGGNPSNLPSKSKPESNLLCQNLSHVNPSHSIYAFWEYICSLEEKGKFFLLHIMQNTCKISTLHIKHILYYMQSVHYAQFYMNPSIHLVSIGVLMDSWWTVAHVVSYRSKVSLVGGLGVAQVQWSRSLKDEWLKVVVYQVFSLK